MTQPGVPDRFDAGLADVEAEHAMQYKLLAEAERLLGGGELDSARSLVSQLCDYSEVHFGSEQVLMRLYSYPGYEPHLREHGELLAALRQMASQIGVEGSAVTPGTIRRWLSAHVQHADEAFLQFVRGERLASNAP